MLAFTRIDTKRIYRKTQVYEPDIVVILDEGLIETVRHFRKLGREEGWA